MAVASTESVRQPAGDPATASASPERVVLLEGMSAFDGGASPANRPPRHAAADIAGERMAVTLRDLGASMPSSFCEFRVLPSASRRSPTGSSPVRASVDLELVLANAAPAGSRDAKNEGQWPIGVSLPNSGVVRLSAKAHPLLQTPHGITGGPQPWQTLQVPGGVNNESRSTFQHVKGFVPGTAPPYASAASRTSAPWCDPPAPWASGRRPPPPPRAGMQDGSARRRAGRLGRQGPRRRVAGPADGRGGGVAAGGVGRGP